MSVRTSTWNVEWCRTSGKAADTLRNRLFALDPDIICLTEVEADFLGRAGHTIACEADHGYPIKGNRRKVLLWSKRPWIAVDAVGHAGLPSGRFISAQTETASGRVLVIGVCIPWFGAHVSTGRRDRQRWEDHLSFLAHLSTYLDGVSGPCILLGDFNQAIPKRRAPQAVFNALRDTVLARLEVVTAGEIAEFGQAIDHIAISGHFACHDVQGLSPVAEEGRLLTDHFGLATVLSRKT